MITERGLLDLRFDELDRLNGTTKPVNPLNQRQRARLDLIGQRLNEIGARERINSVRNPRLISKDLLGPDRDLRRTLGRQRQRLIKPIGVQRLRAATNRCERLQRNTNNVVLRLLRGQRHPTSLGMKPQLQRPLIPRAEPLTHDLRPHPAGRPELRDLLKHIVMRIEKERQTRRELINHKTSIQSGLHIRDPRTQRERNLLHRRAALLPEVIPRDRDRVPQRNVLPAIREQIRRQPHRTNRRKNEIPARDVLLEDVVLHRAPKLRRRHTLLLPHQLIQKQQHRRRRIDRHRRRHPIQRNPSKRNPHIRNRIDRDPRPPNLTQTPRIIRIQTKLRRQIKRHRQPRRTLPQQKPIPLIGLTRRPKPRILPNRPQPIPIHPPMHTTRKRILARFSQPTLEAYPYISSGIDRLNLNPRIRKPTRITRPNNRCDRPLPITCRTG